MKKLLLLLAFAFTIFFGASDMARAQGVICGNDDTDGMCGSMGGCSDGYYCEDGWGINDAVCVEDTVQHCANVNQDQRVVCGVSLGADTWCGPSGGCAQGYMCDASSYTCVKQAICDTISDEYSKQCGQRYGTYDQCGTIGGCSVGYRCVSDSASPTGWSCQQKADANGQMCESADPATPADPSSPATPSDPSDPGDPSAPVDSDPDPNASTFSIFDGPTSKEFQELDPLASFGTASITDKYFRSPAGIISRILLFAFPVAGLILFVMLIWAGFQIIMGATQGTKSIEAGKQRASTAIVGYILLFVAYWIMQIIEIVFSITIL